MKLIATLALVAVAAVGCKTTSSNDTSTAKDFGNPDPTAPQSITAYVPSGGSTTAMIALAYPITANSLSIHTSCNLQLAQVYVTSEIGVGYLANSGDDTTWYAPSGLERTFTAIQLVTNNFGLPAYCEYTVAASEPFAVAESADQSGQ